MSEVIYWRAASLMRELLSALCDQHLRRRRATPPRDVENDGVAKQWRAARRRLEGPNARLGGHGSDMKWQGWGTALPHSATDSAAAFGNDAPE